MSADTRGPGFASSVSPQDYNQFSKFKQWGKISVNQTRGHQCYKWLLVFQETGDSSPTHSRRLNVIADKLSSLCQTGQSRQKAPSCQVFQAICFWWHQPCFLPPGSITNCLNLYHRGQTSNMDNDVTSLDPYAFPWYPTTSRKSLRQEFPSQM